VLHLQNKQGLSGQPRKRIPNPIHLMKGAPIMYSPKIKDALIPLLYQLSKEQGIPMTQLVNNIIQDYLLNIDTLQTQRLLFS